MPERISKIARTLNVGVSTAVEFLHKHGIEVDGNPNTRITDEAVELLTKEFSGDAGLKARVDREREKKIADRNEAKEAKAEAKEAAKAAAEAARAEAEKAKVEKAKADEAAKLRGPKILGKIDLDAPKPAPKPAEAPAAPQAPRQDMKPKPAEEVTAPAAPAKPEPKPEPKSEPRPAPAVQKPETGQAPATEAPAPPAEPAAQAPAPQNEPFRAEGSVPEAPKLRVVGKIDLEALNQTTRPKKKSREERRRERNGQGAAANGGNGQGGDRRKRTRIGKEKVDVEKAARQIQGGRNGNASAQGSGNGGNRSRNDRNDRSRNEARGRNDRNNRGRNEQPANPEDVRKQVKETLARLTNKQTKKSVKWRKEKREEFHNRELANAEREAAENSIIKITEFVTVNDLANMMNVPVNKVIAACMSLGLMVSINQRLDAETINLVADEFGFQTEYVSAEVSEAIATEEDAEEDLVSRPPIVTVMGHVDHGKTSLLDYIRNANVIAGEAGGITQHIGAYNVKLSDGRHITFLDTPGHEAFTAMRARGAKVTDLAIIIVAADDNVMPQTVEAINHATAAGVPMVFAINKIDKPTANPDNIKQELANMNYLVEEWGGKYQSQDISAKKGIGVEELMEKVLLEAEMLDLKANPDRKAVGSVIESSLDKGRGYVATVLVQNGTLRVGDVVLAGTNYGKVKAMFNERNQRVTEAGPAVPVLILGLNGAPQAGDTINVMESEQEAREIAAKREQLQRELSLRTKKRPGLEELGRRRALNDFHELNLVVKGDVDGSVEALSDSLIKLSTPEIQVNVLHKGVGAISESDVTLAAASDAIIIGFQVRPSAAARREAEKEGVEIRLYSVIYKAIEEVKDAMEGLLAPEIKEEITGNAEVLQTYHISKVGTIAGAIVRDGKIKARSKVRVIRDGIVVYTGELGSLKRFKDDAKEVVSGYDCGLSVQGYNDIREGDIIEAFEEVEVKKSL